MVWVWVLSGYDSELEAEANEDYIRDPKPKQVPLVPQRRREREWERERGPFIPCGLSNLRLYRRFGQGEAQMQTVGGRLSHKPLDDMARFACAGRLHAPAGYETRATAVDVSDNTLQLEFVHGELAHPADTSRSNLAHALALLSKPQPHSGSRPHLLLNSTLAS